MEAAKRIDDYIRHTTVLLGTNPTLYGLMLTRQVQGRLLPSLQGSKEELIPALQRLLVFCSDGPDAVTQVSHHPDLWNDPIALTAKIDQRLQLIGPQQAHFPVAAQAVWRYLQDLQSPSMSDLNTEVLKNQ